MGPGVRPASPVLVAGAESPATGSGGKDRRSRSRSAGDRCFCYPGVSAHGGSRNCGLHLAWRDITSCSRLGTRPLELLGHLPDSGERQGLSSRRFAVRCPHNAAPHVWNGSIFANQNAAERCRILTGVIRISTARFDDPAGTGSRDAFPGFSAPVHHPLKFISLGPVERYSTARMPGEASGGRSGVHAKSMIPPPPRRARRLRGDQLRTQFTQHVRGV